MTPNWDPDEHPEDRSNRIRCEAYGRTHAEPFVQAHAQSVARLIGLYADAEAVRLLERLRELFWAELWSPPEAKRCPHGMLTPNPAHPYCSECQSQEGAPSHGPVLDSGGGVPPCDSREPEEIRRIRSAFTNCWPTPENLPWRNLMQAARQLLARIDELTVERDRSEARCRTLTAALFKACDGHVDFDKLEEER